jgi:hypothetical protein
MTPTPRSTPPTTPRTRKSASDTPFNVTANLEKSYPVSANSGVPFTRSPSASPRSSPNVPRSRLSQIRRKVFRCFQSSFVDRWFLLLIVPHAIFVFLCRPGWLLERFLMTFEFHVWGFHWQYTWTVFSTIRFVFLFIALKQLYDWSKEVLNDARENNSVEVWTLFLPRACL